MMSGLPLKLFALLLGIWPSVGIISINTNLEVILKKIRAVSFFGDPFVVDVKVSPKNDFCVEVTLRCLAVEGDGLGLHEFNDGGILASVIATGFKGELPRFQAGVTMEISKLDAWYTNVEGSLQDPAAYIVRGLCRRCCLPELILRCMQVSVTLVELMEVPEKHAELIELVACPETGFLHLFSQQQLQEFLLFEREYSICLMELQEESSRSANEEF